MDTMAAADHRTGLDYFGARYFSAAMGRFTSPDVPLLDQDPADPQSWNLYSYVRNNPLIFTDLTGNDCVYLSRGGTDVGGIDNQINSAQCRETGGYWVDGTVTQARFAHGSLILTGTTSGEDRTSASYALGPDPGLMALQEAGNRAARDLNTFIVAEGVFATAYVSTYAIPAVLAGVAAMNEIGAVGPGVELLKRAADMGGKLVKQFKLEGVGKAAGRSGGHGTPFLRAGAELIRQANQAPYKGTAMAEALKKEGQRLIKKGSAINH